MFHWSFTSLVHFWPPPILNSGYAYEIELHNFWCRSLVSISRSNMLVSIIFGFTFQFRHKSFIVDDVRLAELSNDSFK